MTFGPYMLHDLLIILVILLAVLWIFTLGFVISPRPFRPHPAPSQPGPPTPLPATLPEPVRRHFVETLGEAPPKIETAVVWGRGRARIRGLWVPFRFKAWYRAGKSFYRRMEITWFQRPVMRGVDAFLNGQGQLRLGDRVESGEPTDQAEALALWGDTVWLPPAFVQQPGVHWEPVDETTARLVVPYKNREESLLAHFDAETGRMTHLSAMRLPDEPPEIGPTRPGQEVPPVKEPWRVDLLEWKQMNGMILPWHISVAEGEAGAPWSYWLVDGAVYNVNVSDQLGEE